MKRLNIDEQRNIIGGSITYSAAFLNAICRVVDIIFEVGQNIGSTIRRNTNNSICPIK